MPAAEQDDRNQVRLVLEKINEAWSKGNPESIPGKLSSSFHDAMVIRGPNFQELSRGRQACVQSYKDFLDQARVHQCKLSEPQIDVAGDTAVATHAWEMTYEQMGETYEESGHDLFVFTRANGKWLAAWRVMLPSPPELSI
jgi:ketosteroid isomerase-like protein